MLRRRLRSDEDLRAPVHACAQDLFQRLEGDRGGWAEKRRFLSTWRLGVAKSAFFRGLLLEYWNSTERTMD